MAYGAETGKFVGPIFIRIIHSPYHRSAFDNENQNNESVDVNTKGRSKHINKKAKKTHTHTHEHTPNKIHRFVVYGKMARYIIYAQ